MTPANTGAAVKYQKAQTRTTAHSDDRWHSVLASSPSRPILPKPQAVETPKQKKAPGPGRPVSVIPQGPAEPKRPLSTPLPVEFPLYQTPIPKRKYVRKNAKPLGRPRKYPKTGIPENIESMSAKDIEQMRDSQEMAEKYEVIQMGDEIMKRIEDEEDPILVTDQVLAAANDLRSWEGEDSLPEASIAQILFDFAGGPRPDPASTSGTDWISKLPPAYQPSKTLGRHPRERPYWPSMAAHIYPSHVNRRRPAVILEPFPEKRVDEGEILANRTRRRRAPVGDLRTLTDRKPVPDPTPVVKHVMQYLPSVAAHSQPNLGARSTNTSVPQDKVPRRRGRPPQQREPALPQSPTVTGLKRKRAAKQPIAQHAVSTVPGVLPQYKYLPSIAAHSGSFLPPYVSLSAEVGVKRRRGPNKLKPIARDVESAAPGFLTQYKYLPSIAAHSGSFLPPCVLNSTERGLKRKGVPDFVPSGIDEGAYPGWVQFMSKIYEPQLRNVARPHGGIFLGKTMLRRKRPCEPKGFRPRVFKLVVFKSARLKEFDWFVPETAPSKSTPQRSRSQSLALPAAESINYIRSAPKGTPNLSQLIPLTSISEALMAVRPESSNLSSSAGGNDTKRKRGQSPQPTRGIPPPAPFFRGSTPRMGTSTVTEKPNIPLDLGNAPKGTPSPALSSRRSPPNIKSFTVVEKPKTSLNSRSAPPALGKADSDTTSEDEGPRRTPETPKDMSPCVGEPIVAVSNGQASNKDDPPPQTLKSLVIASQSMAPPGQASEKDDVSPRTSKLHDAALQGMVPPEQVSNEHNAFPQTSKSLVTTLQATAPPTRRSFGPTKKSFGHMSRQGGSSAILRKNVIMDLVEKCGGVFPNHREMSKPFAIEWHKKGQEGYPEPKTLQNAVTALCSENRIRRITFTAQTSQGLNVTKDMIALASIDNADLRVKELQTKIVAAHPRLYLPEAVTPPKDPKCVDAQGSIVWNGDAQDSDGSESADIPHSKVTKRKRRRRNSRGELVNIPSVPEKPSPITTRRARFVPSKLHSRRTGNTSGSIGKILRLATLQNSISAPTSRLPPTPTSGIPSNGIESLTWLSSEYAFSETNFEEERPTILEPANMEGTHRRYARYGTQMDPPQAKRSKDPQEQVKKRMRKMAENAAQIERHQAEVKATRPSLLYSDFGSSSKLSSKIGKLKSSFPSAITVSRRGSMSSERTTPSLSPSAPKVVLNWQPSAFEEAQESTTYRRSFLVGFMDPVHYFYKATGTFSVTFVGLQPPRKIIAHRGTCMYPYKADLKVVDPLVGRKYNAILGPAGRHYYVQPLQERFVEEVDSLLSWELSTEGVQDTVVKGWPIINYDFPHSLTTPETIAADQEAARGLTVCFKDGGSFTTPLRKGRPRGGRRPSSGRRKVPRAEAGTLDSEPKTPLKHRRLLSVAQKKVEDEIVEPDSRPTKYRRLRGPRSAKYLSEEDEQRLLTAVILVRTLTGGIEQHIDWVLVAKVFENEFDQIFVHSRWGYVRNKYTLVLPKMESNFQDLFAQAYEDGTVPKIEFDNLEAYDWKWLVEWVMAKIDTAFQSQPELPAERDEFQDLYTMEEISEIDITDFYEFDRVFNTKKRILVISRSAYVYPLQQGRQSQASEEAEQLSTARSWVRANIITPQETYDPAAARATLSIFSENVIEDALKQLLVDKVLMQQNRGRLVPGRNYDVSTFFLDRLKRKILSAHFQRAIAFKRKLDHDFAEKGSHPYSYTADDGDVLAVFNLMANKRITAVPIDVPLNKWGLTDGGYESRLMNKNRLKTGVELRPLPDYVAGNLLGPYPPPPSQHLQDPNARIPLWYDIHGALVPVMWEMVLSAVLSVLAMRPGAGAVEIEKASKPAMEAWEIESALQWLVDARITKKEATGYTVEEWWWLALGVMEDLVESGANTRIEKGKSKATDAAEDGMVMELDE